jgi:hypothetical protein
LSRNPRGFPWVGNSSSVVGSEAEALELRCGELALRRRQYDAAGASWPITCCAWSSPGGGNFRSLYPLDLNIEK